MQIKLSDHFTYSKLLRFTLPSIIMMIFTSVYSVVDGLFVSNLIGTVRFTISKTESNHQTKSKYDDA